MDPRTNFRIQLLEKLGAPLLAAVCSRPDALPRGGAAAEAERLAELLSRTVQASLGVAASMDLKDSGGGEADAVRLALAAMAGPLIADYYRAGGKVPAEADVQRLVAALEAVLTFADNFTAGTEAVARVAMVGAGSMPVDEHQIHIQTMNALAPVVVAVAAHSFGRPEKKLAQDIAARLVARAQGLAQDLRGSAPNWDALCLLRGLVEIYVACHEREVAQLGALDDAARAQLAQGGGGFLPMDPVWARFETAASMFETLGQSLPRGGGATDSSSGNGPVRVVPPAGEPAAPQAPIAADAANPMAFFKPGVKKASGGGADG